MIEIPIWLLVVLCALAFATALTIVILIAISVITIIVSIAGKIHESHENRLAEKDDEER